MIFSITMLVSCVNGNEKAAKTIVKELNKRYNKSFVVDSIGNSEGTKKNKKIDALVYEDDHKDEMFKAEIKISSSIVKDEYQKNIIKERLQPKIEQTVSLTLGDIRVVSYLGNIMTSNNNEYEDLSDYFKENQYATLSFDVFVKTYEGIDKETEIEKIKEVLKDCKELNYNIDGMTIFYVKEDYFNKFDDEFKNIEDYYDYYGSKNGCYNYVWLDFKGNDILDISNEDILNGFKY